MKILLPVVYCPFQVMLADSDHSLFPVSDHACAIAAVIAAMKKSRRRYPFGNIYVVCKDGEQLFSADEGTDT